MMPDGKTALVPGEGGSVSKQYPRETYCRLLVPHLFLAELKKVLYLAADTIV